MELPKQAEINIGMIGHVDHGKTTLTYALTGKWTDTHSEELKRGISIRVGYADAVFFKDPSKNPPECFSTEPSEGCEVLRRVSFVDSPGHETLLATMLSGAAIMDGAVLVIAANESCPQPQTEEHLLALSIANQDRLIVVQNKIDLVSREKAVSHKEQIVSFLENYGYTDVPIIPTSAHHRVNIDALIWAIEEEIPTPHRDEEKPLRMWVARSFDVNKPGTSPEALKGGVLGGTISQGVVRVGEEVEVSPGINGEPIVTEVVSLSSGDNDLDIAKPGGLIAVGTEIDPYFCKNDRMKGQVVGTPGSLPEPTTNFSVKYFELERKVQKIASEPFKHGEMVALAIGTMPVAAYVDSFSKDEVCFTVKRPVTVEKGAKVAVSRRVGNRWRLVGYGEVV